MKTIIELFDQDPMENLLSVVVFQPEHVSYICDKATMNNKKKQSVYRLLKSRGLKTTVNFYVVDTSDLQSIFSVFQKALDEHEDCVFDFTGGKHLVLLAAGIFCREKKIPGYYIDLQRGYFVNVFGCEKLKSSFSLPAFSVDEILMALGALSVGHGHFQLEEYEEDSDQDILNAWKIIQENQKEWADLVAYLQYVTKSSAEQENGLTVYAPAVLRVHENLLLKCNIQIMQELLKAGIVKNLYSENGNVCFQYKNALLKRCLTDYGVWLELYSFASARALNFFHDVQTSVLVDWDGKRNDIANTVNEIDLILVKGIIPLFVSCKMGRPDALDLDEIRLLSEKFGGSLAKAVMITAVDMSYNPKLYQRAKDMGIYVIDSNDVYSGQLANQLKAIVTNTYRYYEPNGQ